MDCMYSVSYTHLDVYKRQLLMFSAGLETNLKDLMKTGFVAFLIACMGVFVPLVGGTLLYMGFYGVAPWGSEKFYEAVFLSLIHI